MEWEGIDDFIAIILVILATAPLLIKLPQMPVVCILPLLLVFTGSMILLYGSEYALTIP